MMRSKDSAGSRLSDSAENWDRCIEKVAECQDRAAFSALFSHFAPYLKAFLMKGNAVTPETAEELVQETMVKVWRKAGSFSASQASASTWIYTIARNTRIDWFRKQERQNPDLLTAEDIYDDVEEPSPFSSLVRQRTQQNITDHLDTLPSEQMEVLKLMYYEGKSGREISEVLSLPLGTVKSRIRLALSKLRLIAADMNMPAEELI